MLRYTQLLAQEGGRSRPVDPEAHQSGMTVRAEDPVFIDSVFTLEGADRASGVRAEDPVLSSRVEPESVEAPLESGNVVAAHQRVADVKDSVAEAPRCLDEFVPRVGADDAVVQDAARLLKGAHGSKRRGAEVAGLVVDFVSERSKARLYIGHLLRSLSLFDQYVHVRSTAAR
jgi:hypothetical protein